MKEQIYEAVRLKGKVTMLSAFEKNIIDQTLEAVKAEELSDMANLKRRLIKLSNGMYAHNMSKEEIVMCENAIAKELADSKVDIVLLEKELRKQDKYNRRAFTVGLVIGGLIVGIVLTAIFL